jgi:hypothetical protein
VRAPLGRLATTTARNPTATFVVVGVLVVAVVAVVSAYSAGGITWGPAAGPPWQDLPFSLRRGLGLS